MLPDPEADPRPFVVPCLMFTGGQAGKAEHAVARYLNHFPDSRRGQPVRFPAGMEPDEEGTLLFADFQLCSQWFVAMDSAREHDFVFNAATSLLVECTTQAQMDCLSDALSTVPEAEQCGWLKDGFGVSWQITPADLQTAMRQGIRAKIGRVTRAFLPMTLLDVAATRAAYEGSGE